MSVITGKYSEIGKTLKTMVLAVAMLVGVQAFAAEQTARGTIESILEEQGGLTTISGQQFILRPGVTEVFLNGVQVDSVILDSGVVVRYTVNVERILLRVEVIGPPDLVRNYYNH